MEQEGSGWEIAASLEDRWGPGDCSLYLLLSNRFLLRYLLYNRYLLLLYNRSLLPSYQLLSHSLYHHNPIEHLQLHYIYCLTVDCVIWIC